MASFANDSALIQLLESLDPIHSADQLRNWVGNELQTVFPHGAFICGMGHIHKKGIASVKLISTHFPQSYLDILKRPDGLFFSPTIKNWLRSGEVQVMDIEWPMLMPLDPTWLAHFKTSDLRNIAAHGVVDYAHRHVSYFSFHQIPRPWDATQTRQHLKILVPHLHTVLLRILRKSPARPRPVRIDGTLSTRELQVLMWVSEGKTSAEIAGLLGIARNTVRNQMQSALIKLGVNTRSEAVAKAIKQGLVINRRPDSRLGLNP